MRRGIWIFPNRPAAELVDAVLVAEDVGLDEVWIADEGVAREPVAVLAAAAQRTSRIILATGVTSPMLRHPGAIASSLATLDELSGGRAVLGLGLGGQLSLEPFGIDVERPVAVVRDAIGIARSVLARTATRHYRPPTHAMPARSVPIWVGARGPQLVRTAARLSDGLFLSGCSADQHDEIVRHAASVGGSSYALYQSASSAPNSDSELGWDDAHALLASEAARLNPASIGLNLVDAARQPREALIPFVERAASLLRDL